MLQRIRIWHLLVLCLLCGVLTVLVTILAYRSWVTPEAAAPELAEREAPEVAPAMTRYAPRDEPLRVSGAILREDGSPAEVEIAVRPTEGDQALEQITIWSGPDGRYEIEVEADGLVVEPQLASTPDRLHIEENRDDADFTVSDVCGLEVEVTGPDGPVSRAMVELDVHNDHGWTDTRERTGDDGRVSLDTAPCGVGDLEIRAAGYAHAEVDDIDVLVRPFVRVELVRGVELSGVVYDPDGEPIPEVRVRWEEGNTETDEAGRYAMRVDPRVLRHVRARKSGYESVNERMRLPDDAVDDEILDIEMAPTRQVNVYCAGLPDDSCVSVIPVMCTRLDFPFGDICDEEDGQIVCTCPPGESAARAAGESVLVPADASEAWLDLRYEGELRGRVLVAGDPAGCQATLAYIPEGWHDMIDSVTSTRITSCDDEGRFVFAGIRQGTWMPSLQVESHSRQLGAHRIRGNTVDLGDIEFDGGGQIQGYVIDALTGDGAPNEAVTAVAAGVAEGEVPASGTSVSGVEGAFVITGLEDGDYEVFVGAAYFDRETVTVEDGESADVELVTGDADLLEEAGFGLVTDDAGALVVDRVDAGGAAAAGGLMAGDEVVGVSVFGVDPAEWMPDLADEITDAILEDYGGPGVSLQVDRDGQTVEVPLD